MYYRKKEGKERVTIYLGHGNTRLHGPGTVLSAHLNITLEHQAYILPTLNA